MIVDDGSTDDTPLIVERYAKRYPHIKFIKFDCNKGTNAARNAAISLAKGRFSIILDSDDYFVEDAMLTVHTAISENGNYKHYMFAPDDMCPKYENNYLLRGRDTRTLSFADFLSGCISGDFVHVIETETLKKYPFDESLRIYEGTFFLRFYKEAGRMLFTNKTVTIRERSRADSVTREGFRTSKAVIKKEIKSINLWVQWFSDDCLRLGLVDALSVKRSSLLLNYLMLSDYSNAREQIYLIKKLNKEIPLHITLIYRLRCGWMLRLAGKLYLNVKYNLLKKDLK